MWEFRLNTFYEQTVKRVNSYPFEQNTSDDANETESLFRMTPVVGILAAHHQRMDGHLQ